MAERTCDDWVLHAGQPAPDYAETLLQLVPQRASPLALAAVGSRQTLKGRIRRILSGRRRSPLVGRWWSGLAATATAAGVLLMAFAQAATTEKPSAPLQGPTRLSGQVLGEDGKPLAGADLVVMTCPWLMTEPERLALHTGYEVLAQGTSKSDGRFQLQFDPQSRDCPGQQAIRGYPKDQPLPLHVVAAAPGHGLAWLPIHYPLHDQDDVELRLPVEQLIHGLLIDLQGQHAANVQLNVVRVGSPGITIEEHSPSHLNQLTVLLAGKRELSFQDGNQVFSFWVDYLREKSIQFWTAPHDLAAWPPPVVTDAQGRFVLRGIGPSHGIGLVVRDERYAYQMLNVEPRDGGASGVSHRLGASDDSRPPLRTFALPPARLIEGTVVDQETGRPLPHAQVYAESPAFGQRSAEERVEVDWKGRLTYSERRNIGAFIVEWRSSGKTSLPNMPVRTDHEGRFRIQVYQFDSEEGTRSHIFSNHFAVWVHGPEGQAYLDVRKDLIWPKAAVKQSIDVALPKGVLVRGEVRDDRSGQPLAGAQLDLWSIGFRPAAGVVAPGPVQTGRDGVFQLVLPPTHWHLLVNGLHGGLGFMEEPIEIDQLTDNPALLQVRKPMYVDYRDIGRQPSYYPDAWLALDLQPGDPPQSVRIVLKRKIPPLFLSAKNLP